MKATNITLWVRKFETEKELKFKFEHEHVPKLKVELPRLELKPPKISI